MSLLDQIEQGIVEHEVRTLTQNYVASGDLAQADQDAIIAAAWPLVTLMFALYGKAAASQAGS